MASFHSSSLGGLIISLMCEGKHDLSSYCIQGIVIDVVNILFLSTFFLSLIVVSLTKQQQQQQQQQQHNNVATRRERVDRVFVAVSVLCALTGAAHLVSGCFPGSDHRPVLAVARALVWFSLSASLVVRRSSKWTRTLSSVWWAFTFASVSSLNVQRLSRASLGALDAARWIASSLLLICACKKNAVGRRDQCSTTTEPLLDCNDHNNEPKTAEIDRAGLLGRLTFSWIDPLLRLGSSKPLELGDVPGLAPEDEAGLAYRKFAQAWEHHERDRKPGANVALRSIARVHAGENAAIAVLALVRAVSVVASPLILYAFVRYADGDMDDRSLRRGFTILGWLVAAKATESASQRHWFFGARRSGMRMRSALMAAVYRKQLRLSSSGRRRHSAGEVAGYAAVDAYRMGELPWWLHTAWSSAAQIAMSGAALVAVAGRGALPGLVPLAACAALNVPFARSLQRCQRELGAAQDRRLGATAEALGSMKAVKLQSWEDGFRSSVEGKREAEFRWLSEAQLKKATGTFLYWMSPTVVSAAVLAGCAGGAGLDAATVFTVLATLRTMSEPVRVIPEALSALIQAKVSLDRLNSFLLEDEVGEWSGVVLGSEKKSAVVVVREGSFSWCPEGAPTLRRLSLEAGSGQKVAVCGPVGSGKSSLLCAILGEIPKLSGTVDVFGSIAYVSQTSWIQSGTIRDNVLYGKPMQEDRYVKAIRACALDKDIAGFDHGDLTEIGQRGINMSGGQKQRIQLARAVYNDADIYLLDDPFSAVDAQTAALLFNDCVMTALRDKTVILVTHQVEFLSGVDKILVMERGEITQSGSYDELLEAGTAFEQLVNAHKDAITTIDPSSNAATESHGSSSSFSRRNSEEEISAKGSASTQLTREEEREIGDLWKPFRDYISVSKGSLLLGLSVLTQVFFVLFQAASTYWLAFAIQIPKITNATLVGVYTAISLLSTVVVYLRTFFSVHLGLKASKAFFSAFNDAIFRSPMSFFDSTPVGRILTRASSDFSILDFDIPFATVFIIAAVTELVSIIIIMASVTWQVLLVAVFSIIASKYVQGYYLATARELVRINGTTKAPVTNYVSETAQGVVTIRAYRSEDRFFQSFLKLVDTDASLFFLSNASLEWVILRIEALQNLTLFTGAFFLVLLPKGQVAPGLVGLSLSYALSLTGTQIFLTRWYCSLSNYIVSVERIKQFMDIPPEPPAIIESNRPPPSWPTKGRIELHSLSIKYRPNSPLVLKGITCTFDEGTRVGVVGRTGSGKTTLISALFRLVEPTSGKIIIDGLDICSIGLKDLRMKLSIIPQEPTLFRGSIRTNMDPLGLYSDDVIWKALEKCQLKATVSALPNLLDSSVSDEGENWSAGQRQLFCLGRVLLKRNRILVLDEATASIDSATDAILQRIIREEFAQCTVVTVAHRVPTVIDSDTVMVLSYGQMVEYDQPSKLIDANSYFSKLVAEYWASCRRNQ